MRFNWKRGTAALLAGVMTFSTMSTTALAASNAPQKEALKVATATIVTEAASGDISEETAKKIAQEIIAGSYDYSGLESYERGALSTGVKTVLKFIKNNWPKVAKILKKYGIVVAKGKGVTQFINQLLNGVIGVSNSIDEAIYAVVDFVAPNLSSNTKKIIANAIRLISPV